MLLRKIGIPHSAQPTTNIDCMEKENKKYKQKIQNKNTLS